MIHNLCVFIKNRYKLILIVAIALTIFFTYLSSKLRPNMQLMDLLPSGEPMVVAYKKALDNFSGIDSINIVISGAKPNIIQFIKDVETDISNIPHVTRVVTRGEKEFFLKNGLLLQKERELENLSTMLKAHNLSGFIAGLNDNFEAEYIGSQDSSKIERDRLELLSMMNTIEDFVGFFKQNERTRSAVLENAQEFFAGSEYMLSPDQKLAVVMVKTDLEITAIDEIVKLVNNIEGLVKQKQSKYKVTAGLTGILVLQRDEMAVTERDMAKSSLLSIILILVIFFFGFKLLRYTLLAVIPLIIGIIWAMGITYLVIGSLNIFTAMMGAILIGLGIDYAIHIIALYTEARRDGKSVSQAIDHVFAKTIKGVIAGSVTTAIGFVMFGFSSFPGFREFGIVLGIGIICTLFASIITLPAMLIFFSRKSVKLKPIKEGYFSKVQDFSINHPGLMLIFCGLILGLSVIKAPNVKFSTDLKDIEPKGLESLMLNDLLIEKFDISSDITLAVSKTLEHAHELKEKAKDLATVGMVQSITDFLPDKDSQRRRRVLLTKLKGQLLDLKNKVDSSRLRKELLRLENNLIELSDLAFMGGEKKIVTKIDGTIKNINIKSLISDLKANEDNILWLQKTFIGEVRRIVVEANNQRELTLKDLPVNIREDYVGKDNSYLTTIYPKDDVWDNDFQPRYLAQIESLNIPLTGTFMVTNKVMEVAGREGARILLYVVITIFIVLLFDFRSPKFALLAMIPMSLTLITLVGIMAWFGIKFDFVNILALPIIIGIGVDDGVHLIHRYLIERDLKVALLSTGRGILLTSLTTSAAFGTLIIAEYQGFASFGLLLILGILLAYISTVILLPALIKLLDNIVDKSEDEGNKGGSKTISHAS